MSRRRLATLVGVVAVVLALLLGIRFALQPERVTTLLLSTIADALGLEITATGVGEYRLGDRPTLVVRDLVAREPGAATPVLRAARVQISVPWSTVRSRGAVLDIVGIELDAPRVDVAALQAWLARRPDGESPFPTIREGVRIRDGAVLGAGWALDNVDIDLRELHPQRRVAARATGRLLAAPTTVAFDLALAMTRPAAEAGVGIVGRAALTRDDVALLTRGLPLRFKLSGPVRARDGGVRVAPLHAALSTVLEHDGARLPVALGLHGPLHFDAGALSFAPLGIVLRGDGVVPGLVAAGSVALEDRLSLALRGQLDRWPAAWPALPPPLDQADGPMPFALDYAGKADLSQPARIRLRHAGAAVDARLVAGDVAAWAGEWPRGTPLPPMSGRATVDAIEIAGARLEGVELEIEDPDLAAPGLAEPGAP